MLPNSRHFYSNMSKGDLLGNFIHAHSRQLSVVKMMNITIFDGLEDASMTKPHVPSEIHEVPFKL